MSKKVLKFLGGCIILIFLFCYFIEYSGYYEYNLHNKKNLTEEQIEKFESDVKSGKNIDISTYFTSNKVDYSNNLTDTVVNANLKLNEYIKNFIKGGFNLLGKFIN